MEKKKKLLTLMMEEQLQICPAYPKVGWNGQNMEQLQLRNKSGIPTGQR